MGTSHKQASRLVSLWLIDADIAEKGHFWMETSETVSTDPGRAGLPRTRLAIVALPKCQSFDISTGFPSNTCTFVCLESTAKLLELFEYKVIGSRIRGSRFKGSGFQVQG